MTQDNKLPKLSKLNAFRRVTGESFTKLTAIFEDVTADRFEESLEVLLLGVYLITKYTNKEAKREYERLMKEDYETERYEILDGLDLGELLDAMF